MEYSDYYRLLSFWKIYKFDIIIFTDFWDDFILGDFSSKKAMDYEPQV